MSAQNPLGATVHKTAYQYDSQGYYAGRFNYQDRERSPLPANCVAAKPQENSGFIPHWNGSAWEQVENHKGEQGWLNGEPYTITDYGPYPDGWSATPPPPTLQEAKEAALAALKEKRLAVEYAGPLVEVNGEPVRFPSEVKDETRLNSLAGLFMADPAALIPDWKVAEGVYVTMTYPLLQQVKTAGFAHIAATFSVERQKREEVEALQSVAAVEAWRETELEAGWPA